MSVDLVASNTHGNLDEQIAQLMQCKSLSKPEDEQYPSKGLYQNWGLNFIIDWNSHDLKGALFSLLSSLLFNGYLIVFVLLLLYKKVLDVQLELRLKNPL
ncbi:unnamed protein product [Camellia sinensis]